jgi:hypothetical protein
VTIRSSMGREGSRHPGTARLACSYRGSLALIDLR